MRPLLGKKILVTRDIRQAGAMISSLTDLGAEVICIPTIKITDPPEWNIFDTAVACLNDYDWLLFSSTNAVHQTMKRLLTLKIDFGMHSRVLIAVVGSQTAAAVESYSRKIDLIPETFQAEGLVKNLLDIGMAGKRVLIPRAVDGREYLVEALENAGAEVVVAPVYQNVLPLENANRLIQVITNGDVDWMTFTSSSTAINFFQMFGDSINRISMPKIASIGSITSKTLANRGSTPLLTANPQNVEGIIQGIVEWEKDNLRK